MKLRAWYGAASYVGGHILDYTRDGSAAGGWSLIGVELHVK